MSWLDKDGNEYEGEYDDDEQYEQRKIISNLSYPEEFDSIKQNEIISQAVKEITPDISNFLNAQHENLLIFLKAREEHGNHLDNPEWYNRAGLAIKCWRYIKAYQEGRLLTNEELADLSNYAIMVLSRRYSLDMFE